MAGKKAKKKAKPVEKEVFVDTVDDEAEATPEPAIPEPKIYKSVEKGQATWYTEAEYRKKFG